MVKQQAKQAPKQKNMAVSKSWLIIGITSLALNTLLIVLSIIGAIGYSTGRLDYAIVNKGYSTLCSDKFRDMSMTDKLSRENSTNEQKLRIAQQDYECLRPGADKYYSQGFKDYANSLGLNTESVVP